MQSNNKGNLYMYFSNDNLKLSSFHSKHLHYFALRCHWSDYKRLIYLDISL